MSPKPTRQLIASVIICAALPSAASADPANIQTTEPATFQALFQASSFSKPCPLAVYNEDYSAPKDMRQAAPLPDGLGAYGDEFNPSAKR